VRRRPPEEGRRDPGGLRVALLPIVACALLAGGGVAAAATGAPAARPAPAAPATPPAAPPSGDTEVIRIDGAEGASAAPETLVPETSAPSPASAQGTDARVILADLWFKHQALLQRGSTKEAAALLDRAIAFMEREGVRAAPEIADAFLAEGRRDRRDGDLEGAIENHRRALRFDPGRADARLALAVLLIRSGHGFGEAVGLLKTGVTALVTDPEALLYLAGGTLLLLYLGACGGLAIAVLLSTIRVRMALAHDLQERFRPRLSATTAAIAAAAILALPLLVPVPLTWTLSFWAALLLPYLRGGERLVAASALVALLGAGAFGVAVAWQMDTATDPTARALLQAARTGADLRNEATLRKAMRDNLEDPVYPFLLGSAYRVGGRFDEAMTMYRRVLQLDARHARAMVNLGNLHALRQEFAQAQALYKKAVEVDPTLALAYFDSHLAYLETFDMEAADSALRAARGVDEALVTRLVARAGAGAERRAPQDCRYTASELWGRALRLRREPANEMVRAAIANPASIGAAAGLLGLLLLPGLGVAPRSQPADLCGRCGQGYCRRCQVATKFPGYCSPCVHLFFLRDGLAPSVRDRKMEAVVRFRRRHYLKTRVLSLVLPGSGHVLGGRALAGAVCLVLWSTAWAGLILRGRLLVPPDLLPGVATAIALLTLATVGLVAWLLANLTRQEEEEE
jgi:tetratricopeptide (TPR) repeat protein